eukprot:TRINITY_DN1240_c0_g1_i4.p1 TRINITY_DN1240_c0_g1~~TRINITY_DN1240_c0_g1_i4.p1  ORF type:complete len:468 (+),score=98.23 TRINITY_DN1240_c0_g1_i4:172-1575(+)
MLRSLVGSEMCIRDRYQRRVRGKRILIMGACTSGCTDGDLNGLEDHPLGHGSYVVEVVEARNLPREDHCDPFAKFWIEDAHDGLIKGERCRTLTRRGTLRPVWRSVRQLAVTPDPSDILEVELWDLATMGSDGPLGVARILVGEIDVKPRWFDLLPAEAASAEEALAPGSLASPMQVSLRCIPGDPPVRKTIFLIRHGESVWNEAQKNGALTDMLAYDHPLNQTGIAQAKALNRSWKEARRAAGGSLGAYRNAEHSNLQAFFNADQVISSPFTRALQTALIGLHELPACSRDGIVLSRTVREIKGIGGLDSVGSACGVEVARRAEDCLGELMGASEAKHYMVVIDPADTTSEWWTGVDDRDTTSSLNDRFIELMYTIRYGGSKAPIIVGHSLFFRNFFQRFTGAGFRGSAPELADNLMGKKISNAGCVAVDLEFAPNPSAGQDMSSDLRFCQITSAELMFGTSFSEH